MKLKSGASLFAAQIIDVVLPFIRSVALARIISQEQLGLVFSLSAAIMIIEMVTDFGVTISAVRRTDRPDLGRTYSTLHTISAARSAVVCIILILVGPALAFVLRAPDVIYACAFLGIVSFLRGFENLGVKELTRNYVFGPDAAVAGASQIAWTSVSIGTAFVFRDFTCLLWGLLAATMTTVILSHVLSPRPWRLGWDEKAAREAVRFGLPLIPNGIASALAYTDRLFIASMLSVSTLALYGILMSFVTLPRTVVGKLANAVLIPAFANRADPSDAPTSQAHLYSWWVAALGFLAFGYALLLIVIGTLVVGLLYGSQYSPSRALMCIIAINVFIKMLMHMPVPAALAFGQSSLVFRNSGLAAIANGAACLSLFFTQSLEIFLLILTFFELLVLVAFVYRAICDHQLEPSQTWFAVFFPLVALLALTFVGISYSGVAVSVWVSGASISSLAFLICYALFYIRLFVPFKLS